jgi:prophage antirepressor-like protein
METTKIAVFRGMEIRKTIHKNEWWFSITDVIEALTGNERPRKYWNDLKKKLIKEGYSEVSEKIGQLKLQASDGKNYLTDCANTETLFRIIQTIPSPKAEPFKRWLARVLFMIFNLLFALREIVMLSKPKTANLLLNRKYCSVENVIPSEAKRSRGICF